ncbi:MAG: KilA-N domain-containing protein, partial [Spirochaetales bacterium]|nr:KilA-N domain-containing protein [Spirochaetales bacterium]
MPKITVENIEIRKQIDDPNFNHGEFAIIKSQAGLNSFKVSVKELVEKKEFQRLKEAEQKLLGWSAKRELAKINYHLHTDAIKENLIPSELTPKQASVIYADEADVLNVALFGITAREWRDKNPNKKGNLR